MRAEVTVDLYGENKTGPSAAREADRKARAGQSEEVAS